MDKIHFEIILNHYVEIWKNSPKIYFWDKGPIEKLPSDFRVLEFPPSISRNMWTYATCGMSDESKEVSMELHLFSSIQDTSIVELLTSVVYYDHNTSSLGLNHSVNFGRPWQNQSICEYGLISLPYLDGPELENLYSNKTAKVTKFYWLIPVTETEIKFKAKFGLDALEEKFDKGLDYANPNRPSLVG